MHAASSLHDLSTLPRIHNSCALLPIFVMRDIQTIGALVPPTTAMLYSPHMATKTRMKKSKATLDSVLPTVERSFADAEGKMDRGFAAVAEDITDIKSKMATKD